MRRLSVGIDLGCELSQIAFGRGRLIERSPRGGLTGIIDPLEAVIAGPVVAGISQMSMLGYVHGYTPVPFLLIAALAPPIVAKVVQEGVGRNVDLDTALTFSAVATLAFPVMPGDV